MSELHFMPDDVTPIPQRKLRITTLMIGVLVVGGSIGMLGRSVMKAREAARASQCFCIKQIALALHNYHDAYGCLPPAYVADENGKPMHSWRVLILPFLYQGPPFDSYDMAEPWDGPNNRKLLNRCPNVYRCPSRDCDPSLTCYAAIVGPKTAFPGAGTTRFADFQDGTEATIVITEIANVDIPWTEPRDLDTRTMSWRIDDPARPGPSSPHGPKRGPAVIYADGAIRRLDRTISPATLQALTTINGQELVDR